MQTLAKLDIAEKLDRFLWIHENNIQAPYTLGPRFMMSCMGIIRNRKEQPRRLVLIDGAAENDMQHYANLANHPDSGYWGCMVPAAQNAFILAEDSPHVISNAVPNIALMNVEFKQMRLPAGITTGCGDSIQVNQITYAVGELIMSPLPSINHAAWERLVVDRTYPVYRIRSAESNRHITRADVCMMIQRNDEGCDGYMIEDLSKI